MEYHFSSDVMRIKYVREAANVQRTHCSPSLGDHGIGKHSFNMVTMLMILKPNASRELILACIQHDIPERTTGDMPHPAKKGGIQNTEAQEKAENNILSGLFGLNYTAVLDEEDLKWMNGLDMLEFYCYVRDELANGRSGLTTKLNAVRDYMQNYGDSYPSEIVTAFSYLEEYPWYDMPDMGGM